jgi:hypothetical protein
MPDYLNFFQQWGSKRKSVLNTNARGHFSDGEITATDATAHFDDQTGKSLESLAISLFHFEDNSDIITRTEFGYIWIRFYFID